MLYGDPTIDCSLKHKTKLELQHNPTNFVKITVHARLYSVLAYLKHSGHQQKQPGL